MGNGTLELAFRIVFYAVMAGVGIAFVRAMIPEVRRRLLREQMRGNGVLAVGRVVEVNVLEEGSEGGQRMLLGVVPVVTARNRDGSPVKPGLATYRVLIRYTPEGQAEVVADAEQALTPAQLDRLGVDAEVEIRYDPAQPDRVVLAL
jgi:hypothetical protein